MQVDDSVNPSPPPSSSAVVSQIEALRPYLQTIAARGVPRKWRGKLSASDLVQQTMMEAAFAPLPSLTSSGQHLRLKLRRILSNNILDAIRRLKAKKRAADREVDTGDSAIANEIGIPAAQWPEAVAIRCEEASRLDAAIARLEPHHRRAIQLRHREGLSFDQIAQQLGISPQAAQKLWARAVKELKSQVNQRHDPTA
jgi:RNA polymerase sigma-70 factor (ECF subfamily)